MDERHKFSSERSKNSKAKYKTKHYSYECENGCLAKTADIHQLDRALLHTLGAVNHHQGGINGGQCTTIRWEVENVTAVWVYPLGQPYEQYPTTGSGSQQVCPSQTTTYELRVQLNDGSVQVRQVTINVQSTNPLVNTSWAVSSMYVNQVPLPGTSLTAFFDAANSVSGSAGCNNYTGPYSVSGNAISIGPLQGTNATCGADIDSQEQVYLTAMQSATTYQLVGSQLVLICILKCV